MSDMQALDYSFLRRDQATIKPTRPDESRPTVRLRNLTPDR